MAVTVHVCDFEHVPEIVPPTAVTDGVPQLSVTLPALAIAFAAVGNVGLHPRSIDAIGHAANTGLTKSDVQVYVTEHTALFPQPSKAVTVHVCVFEHVPVIDPPTAVTDATVQLSVTLPALATAFAGVGNVGLHPRLIDAVGHAVN